LLLDHGANVHETDDYPVRMAYLYGTRSMVDLLIRHGADKSVLDRLKNKSDW